MRSLREWFHRLVSAIRPARPDSDLEEELRLHLELAAEEARRRSDGTETTVRAARMRAGGMSQAMEALRDQRGVPVLSGLGQDLRLAFRSFRAMPTVTVVAVLSLGLAVGANTAIFSLVNGLLLRPLPVHEPSRLVHITDNVLTDSGETRVRAWSYPAWREIRDRHLFDAATACSLTRFNLALGGEAQFVDGLQVDGGFFDVLGVPAVLGRTLTPDDDLDTGAADGPAAVISYGYWHRQFGGAADAIGRTIRLNGVLFTIVGVLPPEFFGIEVGRTFDVIVPLRSEALIRGKDSVLESAASNFLTLVARLRSDQSIETAIAGLQAAQAGIREATMEPWEKEVRDRYLTAPFTLVPAATGSSNLRRSYQTPLVILAAVVSLVLLIGCLNVANLLLARAIGRRHELSVQVALGASRWRLARQHLSESVVLAIAGAVLGVAVGGYLSEFLVWQLSTPANTVFLDVSIDRRVLAFAILVTAATTLLFGTAPAIRAARSRPIDAMREQGRFAIRAGGGGLMRGVVVAQAALSLLLLVAAGLFIRSFTWLANRPLGLDPDPVLVVTIDSVRAEVDPARRVPLYERAREAVLTLPRVGAAAISHVTPIGGGGFTPAVEVSTDAAPARSGPNGEVYGNLISPGWLDTFRTRVRRGRDFMDDDRKGAHRVALVNERLVRSVLGGADPIGRTLTVYPNTARSLQMEIVGVVEDAVYGSPREAVPPTWYAPIAQFEVAGFPFATARLSVRAETGSPTLLTRSVAAAIESVHPDLALTFRPLAGQLHASLTRERLLAQLAGFFGVVALLLASLGLYGVTAHATSTRRTEIGIRLALGANPTGVTRLVLGRIWLMMSIGTLLGGVISLWASRFVSGLVYGLPARDPMTIAAAAFVLFAVATIAGWLPARRAGRIDPGAVLRES